MSEIRHFIKSKLANKSQNGPVHEKTPMRFACGVFALKSQDKRVNHVRPLLAVEGHDVLLVSSNEQDWTVETAAKRVQPGHVERSGTVCLRDGERH